MGLSRISAFNGSIYEGSTNARTGIFFAFTVNADAVVSACTIVTKSGATTTTDTAGVTTLNISGATLKQGLTMFLPADSWISSITLASGSIVLHKK